MNVMTLKQHRYKGKLKNIGDEYEFIGRAERKLAIALGWVIPAPKYVEPAKPVAVEQAPAKAEEVVIFEPEIIFKEEVEQVEVTIPEDDSSVVVDVKYKPRRTYKRRDMVSDE
jgi:hypothetical protein